MLPEPLLWYIVLRILVGVVAVGAIVAFLLTYLRRTTKHKGLLRTVSLIVLVSALVVLLSARSPLDYHTTAPAPADARLYAISNANDLYALRATDGSRTFIRHLPGAQGQLQYIAYDVDGLLIMSAPAYGFQASTQSGVSTYVSVATMRAFRRDDGADALPALRALANITSSIVNGNMLYVATIDDMAHRDMETLHAFSLPDGVELWHSALTTTAQPNIWGVDQGILYIQLDTSVAAVRTTDGALIWQSPSLAKSFGHIEPFAPSRAGWVYVRVAGGASNDVSVVKLNARDGSQQWTLPGVTFGAISDNRLYGIQGTKVKAFDISSGKQIWEQQGVEIRPVSYGIISAAAGVLYFAGQRTLANGLPSGACDVFAIHMSDNAELWRQTPHKCGYVRSLLVSNGILYYTTTDGDFTAFRAADGGILWTHTGYSRSGLYTHWSDSFDVKAGMSGVAFIYSNHDGPCALLGGCDANYSGPCRFLVLCDDPNVGQYIEAVNPTTGSLYWRYRLDDIHSYLFDDGSA
ncbi:MAG: outer membrane protein assembly factor BamB family protein [Ktedonobacterales bacterium]